MNKLIFLFVALLATLASVNAQVSAPVTVSISTSQTVTSSNSLSTSVSSSLSSSVSSSFSNSLSNSVSNSVSNSLSNSVSTSHSASVSWSLSQTISMTMTNTQTMSGSGTPSMTMTGSGTATGTGSVTASFSNTISGTQSVTQTGSISASFSSSVSAPATMSGSMSPAPPPASISQVTAGCGAGRQQICIAWTRPVGVPALNYVVTITGQVTGAKNVYNFTMGETFAMLTGLKPATAYTITVQTLFFGTLSSPATITITTAAPGPKQNPALGITGFTCRSQQVPGIPKKQRGVVCSWTNGPTPYTLINLRIKCTGLFGSGFAGKHKNVKRTLKPGLSTYMEKGFFVPARCKVIANAAYSTGPGRRIVQILNVV